MDLNQVSQLATAVSSIVAAGSIYAVFHIYKIGRRDDKIKKIREHIVTGKTSVEKMNAMLSHEMAYEITQAIISTPRVKLFLLKIFSQFFKTETPTTEELEAYLENNMPSIYGSLRSPWTQDFEEELNILEFNAANIEFDHPAVARTMYANRGVLRNSYYGQKRLVQDEDAWTAALKQLLNEKRDEITSVEELTDKITGLFVGTAVNMLKKGGQDNIDDCLSSLEIVVRSYLEMTAEELLNASNNEKSISLIPVSETKTVSDDLREAEKAFDKILTHEALMSLRQYSSQVEAR